MSSDAYNKYLQLEAKRHVILKTHKGTQDELDALEDPILEAMDPLWWEMTEEERASINEATRKRATTPRTDVPKKYTCAWCRKKFVSEIRPPLRLPDGAKHGRVGVSNKVEKLGEPIVIQGHAVSPPGGALFEGSEFACSVECYENLTGQEPPDGATHSQGASSDQS